MSYSVSNVACCIQLKSYTEQIISPKNFRLDYIVPVMNTLLDDINLNRNFSIVILAILLRKSLCR